MTRQKEIFIAILCAEIMTGAVCGCVKVFSPGLQVFYGPRHLVYFLLQASDDFTLLFGAGICALIKIGNP